jgi:large subunit ribosomal protein L7/L12
MADLNKLVEDLSGLSVLEAAQLTKLLEEKWGVSAAAPVAMAAMPAMAAAGAGAAAAAPVEEKTEFNVLLKDVGAKKIEVIKVIRQLTNLGLKEAKDMAETAGAKVLEAVSKEAAEDAKKKLVEAGATVDVV